MTLFLDENCVTELVNMDDTLEVIEAVFSEVGHGKFINMPRIRVPLKCVVMRITVAVLN